MDTSRRTEEAAVARARGRARARRATKAVSPLAALPAGGRPVGLERHRHRLQDRRRRGVVLVAPKERIERMK